MHPLPHENFHQTQPFPPSEEIATGKGEFDGIIPDGIPASIKPFLRDIKPNGGSVVFQIPEAEPAYIQIERQDNRRKVATGLIAAALVVGAISIGRFFLKK
jgi:hypothetical protein